MTWTDYAFSIALILLVVRQLRGKRLSPFGLAWPVALVAVLGADYVRAVPGAGNDRVFVAVLALCGLTLGVLCGRYTRIHRVEGQAPIAQATGVAAALWVLGIGARIAFALYAEHGGGAEIAQLSAAWHITSGTVWATALVTMALTEVVGRTVVLGMRAYRPQPTQPVM